MSISHERRHFSNFQIAQTVKFSNLGTSGHERHRAQPGYHAPSVNAPSTRKVLSCLPGRRAFLSCPMNTARRCYEMDRNGTGELIRTFITPANLAWCRATPAAGVA